jgi:hypothetical protein
VLKRFVHLLVSPACLLRIALTTSFGGPDLFGLEFRYRLSVLVECLVDSTCLSIWEELSHTVVCPWNCPRPSPESDVLTALVQAEGYAVADLTPETRSILYGLQIDFMYKQVRPSVACIMVFPFSGNHYTKLYWGTDETLIPVYVTIAEAVAKHPETNIMRRSDECLCDLFYLFCHSHMYFSQVM